MKYPRPWEASGENCYVSSHREGAHADKIEVSVHVDRPGTSDHARLIRTRLSLEKAKQLRDHLMHHIDLLEKRI